METLLLLEDRIATVTSIGEVLHRVEAIEAAISKLAAEQQIRQGGRNWQEPIA